MSTNRPQFATKFTGDLPYYVPFPENVAFEPSRSETDPYHLIIQHFHPLRHPDDSSGTGVDDRIGTYLRSRVIIEFTKLTGLDPIIMSKALSITNSLVEAIRYYTSDYHLRPILNFDHTLVERIGEEGECIIKEHAGFGPFGLEPQRFLDRRSIRPIWELFNGIMPMNPARMLILDAKYHASLEDFNRAILDLGTALEIHIGWLMNYYEPVAPLLEDINIEDTDIWRLYNDILQEATGHSLQENQNLYIELEYIRNIRNSITHEWKAVFRITKHFRSNFISEHQKRDGTLIRSKCQIHELIDNTQKILDYTDALFQTKYHHSTGGIKIIG